MCLNGNSLGLFLGSLFKESKVAVTLLPLLTMTLMLFGGFFMNRSNLMTWISWFEYLSPVKYGFQGIKNMKLEIIFKKY